MQVKNSYSYQFILFIIINFTIDDHSNSIKRSLTKFNFNFNKINNNLQIFNINYDFILFQRCWKK